MHTATSKLIFENLFQKYKTIFVNKHVTSYEIGSQECTLNAHMGIGMGIPPYLKMGAEKGAKIIFNIHDIAFFLASDTRGILTREVRQSYIEDFLSEKSDLNILGKKELSGILDVSTNTIGKYMKKGILSPYKKRGLSLNGKVTFNSSDISKNLSCVVETM